MHPGLLGEREMRAVRAGLRAWQLLSSDAGTAPELVEMAGGENRLTWDEIEHLAESVERGAVHLLHLPPPPPRGTRCACGALAGADGPIVGVQGLASELRAVLRIDLGDARRAAWRLMENCGAIAPPPEGCCHGKPVDFGVLQSWRCPAHPRSSVESEPDPDDTRAAAGGHVYICWGYRSPEIARPGESS